MKTDTEKRVIVLRAMVGIFSMQVCAQGDATDQEILNVCNKENPSGTTNGWMRVVRKDSEHPECNPVNCADIAERTHFQVRC